MRFKVCNNCGETKVEEEFHSNGQKRADGSSCRRQPCSSCRSNPRERSYTADIERGNKSCRDCNKTLTLDSFILHTKAKPEYYDTLCRSCRKSVASDRVIDKYGSKRSYTLFLRYGITEDDFDDMANSQNGKCAICERDPKRLVVDHCHRTGKVRGLLCDPCNVILGKWKDDSRIAARAAKYLEKGFAV